MSGIEIVGLIGSCVALFEASIKAYNVFKDFRGIPDAFEEVINRLPLVENTLNDAKAKLEKTTIDEALASKTKPLLESCQNKASELNKIFEKLAKSKGGKFKSAYRTAVGMFKEHRVEDLMKDILRDIEVLVGNQTLRLATKEEIEQLHKAIEELSQVKPSIPDSKFASGAGGVNNFGKGKQNIAFGDGDIIDSAGDVYKAQKQWINHTCNNLAISVNHGHCDRQVMLDLIRALQLLQRQLPPQIDFLQMALVIDARGEPMPIPLQTITSKEIFVNILKHRFKDLGGNKIARQEWLLVDSETRRPADLSRPWHVAIKPNRVFYMSMVFKRRKQPSTQCPSCGYENPGSSDQYIECSNCPLAYRRIEEVQGIGVSAAPKPTSTPRPQKVPQNTPAISVKYPRPRPAPQPPVPGEQIASYTRVQVVDTSFQIQKYDESNTLNHSGFLSLDELDDLDTVAAYLAIAYGIPEDQCLAALENIKPQLVALKDELRPPRQKERRRYSSDFRDDESISKIASTSTSSIASGINNPRLFAKVEDAIKRLILPELNRLKRERGADKEQAVTAKRGRRRSSFLSNHSIRSWQTSDSRVDNPFQFMPSDISSMPPDSLLEDEEHSAPMVLGEKDAVDERDTITVYEEPESYEERRSRHRNGPRKNTIDEGSLDFDDGASWSEREEQSEEVGGPSHVSWKDFYEWKESRAGPSKVEHRLPTATESSYLGTDRNDG